MKKILAGVGAIAAVAVVLPMFAAFEAHVVNVTATIENALSVPTSAITFGTIFPQEHLSKPLDIALSQSFLAENRVDDVNYVIRQKPKCAITSNDGKTIDEANTKTGEVIPSPTAPNGYTIDCGQPPRALNTDAGESWGVLPNLCPYLSKEGPDQNDGSLLSFHQPWSITNGQVVWNQVLGHLAKSEQDTEDTWNIDVAAPCFAGQCAQDWAKFVTDINPKANPVDYIQPKENEHKVFGCDLWVEVTGVSNCNGAPTTNTVVSDTTNTVFEKGNANAEALTFIHPAWTATPSIPGATWIWAHNPVEHPGINEQYSFDKQFTITSPVTSATLDIAADNTYDVQVNGVLVGADNNQDNFSLGQQDSYPITNLVVGTNTIRVVVTNIGIPGSTPEVNPAGLLYKLTYNTASPCAGE